MYELARLDMFSVTIWIISVATRTTAIVGCRYPEFLTPLSIALYYTLLAVGLKMLELILLGINRNSAKRQHQ